jgi:hypothetical protein
LNDTFKANFQRVGAVSNAHVGRDFEAIARQWLQQQGISTSENFAIPIAVGSNTPKLRRFDLGSDNPKVLVECKSHRWTSGDKMPSAKMTVWNEAMYYFHLAPSDYRKIMFVLHDISPSRGESLVAYYLRTHGHLVPAGVEFWEYDASTQTVTPAKAGAQ